MSEEHRNQRQYQRHALHYEVEIYDGAEEQPIERSLLKDVSGGGVCFLSRHPDRYAVGQDIVLAICLPHTDLADARMKGHGRIAWIGDPGDDDGGSPVGVMMVDLMAFERAMVDAGRVKAGS